MSNLLEVQFLQLSWQVCRLAFHYRDAISPVNVIRIEEINIKYDANVMFCELPEDVPEKNSLFAPAIGGGSSHIIHGASWHWRKTDRADGVSVLSQVNLGNFDQGKIILQTVGSLVVFRMHFITCDGECSFSVLSFVRVVFTWSVSVNLLSSK